MKHRWIAVAAFVSGVAAAGLAAVVVEAVTAPDLGIGPTGAIHSVMLTNGQVYYGSLQRVSRSAVVLTGVFYVQASPEIANAQCVNRLVSRADADWHGPTSMSVPLDKILFIEVVGPESTVAKLIAEAKLKRGS